MNALIKIPTYVINLRKRIDRKENILIEFKDKPEFDFTIIDACEHQSGNVGLWKSICKIIELAQKNKEEFVLICEDDHQFTTEYDKENLFSAIRKALELGADVLSGGVSWLDSALPASERIFWTNKFTGTQFIVVFKSLYNEILRSDFNIGDIADHKLSSLSSRIFFLFPFISTQKDYGYSDVTIGNNVEGYVSLLFQKSAESVTALKDVMAYYKKQNPKKNDHNTSDDFDSMKIPVYVIHLPERIERKKHILQQFEGKNEFDIVLTDACKHKIGALGLWLSIRHVVEKAIYNDDDVIIICEDDHEFTPSYSKEYLFRNIIEAHSQGTDFLSGGSGGILHALPVSNNRYWGAECLSTQFIIVFRKFFNRILEEPFDEKVIADKLLSEMTSNKQVLYPFISCQRDFGYSDVTPIHNIVKGLVNDLFAESSRKLTTLNKAYKEFCL